MFTSKASCFLEDSLQSQIITASALGTADSPASPQVVELVYASSQAEVQGSVD